MITTRASVRERPPGRDGQAARLATAPRSLRAPRWDNG